MVIFGGIHTSQIHTPSPLDMDILKRTAGRFVASIVGSPSLTPISAHRYA